MVISKGLSLKQRILLTAVVTILVWLHLIWDHFHGGVPAHYFLRSEDMPAISNWWGGFTLPIVTYLLIFLIHKNLMKVSEQDINKSRKKLIINFICALVFGILISVFFSMGSPAPGYMMLAAILLSFFLPLYRPEYLLGFILGMSYTFGANIPILAAIILLLIFLIAYKLIRFGLLKILSREV